MRYLFAMDEIREVTQEASTDVIVEKGCQLCGGPLAVRLSASRAVTVCKACSHFSVALVERHGGHMVFQQILRAAA
jgi:hypothetical protein